MTKYVRKGDWRIYRNTPASGNADPLIDAACKVLNDFQHSSVRHAFIDNLAAELILLGCIEEVKPERFSVDERTTGSTMDFIADSIPGGVAVVAVPRGIDPAEMAAALNELAGE